VIESEALRLRDYQIRKVTPDDIAEWCRMRTQLWPDSADDHSEELTRFFNQKSIDIVETYVVDRGLGKLGGFIELNIRNFAEGSRQARVPYIEGWFIDKDLRQKGYGSRLIRQAEVWAKMLGYSELASDAEIDNRVSIQAHLNLGFEEQDRVVCFLKQLPDK